MLYTRHDLRLASRGWYGGVLEEGVVPGDVLGVALNASARQVIYTLVPRRRAAKLPGASAHQTGTARTELPTGEVRLTGRARVYVGGRAVGRVSRVWCDRLSGLVTLCWCALAAGCSHADTSVCCPSRPSPSWKTAA